MYVCTYVCMIYIYICIIRIYIYTYYHVHTHVCITYFRHIMQIFVGTGEAPWPLLRLQALELRDGEPKRLLGKGVLKVPSVLCQNVRMLVIVIIVIIVVLITIVVIVVIVMMMMMMMMMTSCNFIFSITVF